MRHWLGLILAVLLSLAGCASTAPSSSQDLFNECWMNQINTNTLWWIQHASNWFLSSDPNLVIPKGMKALSPTLADFSNIQIDGDFKVQITSGLGPSRVVITGPSGQVEQIVAKSCHNTLYLYHVRDNNIATNQVIVHVIISDLRCLTHNGACPVEGMSVISSHLIITANGSGNVLLDGSMNLSAIHQNGSGTITVIGAFTPTLTVDASNHGNVNVSGIVGIRSIRHNGDGTINIIGARSDSLTICATGGLITIAGYVNLKNLTARGRSRVYAYWVSSNHTCITVANEACVGLAGATRNLTLDASGNGGFQGRQFYSDTASIRLINKAHATIAADRSLFAVASDNSSLYFVGSPKLDSRYASGNAVILPLGNEGTAPDMPVLPDPDSLSPPEWKPPVIEKQSPYRHIVIPTPKPIRRAYK